MRNFVLILLVPVALFAQAAAPARAMAGARGGKNGQQAPPPPPTPAADLASLEGTVYNALGGTPLRKATVTVNRQNGGPLPSGARANYSATTDASGRYSISGIEPGTYRVMADRTGYLNMSYNARKPGGSGTPLDLGRAQKMTGVDFKLTPHGVVSGKITDEDGDPLEGVQVQIMRIAYNQGKKQLQMNGGEQTNDLGEYRLSGITPGKYFLSAIYRGRRFMIGSAPDPNVPQEDYVTTFYPGVSDIAAASPIEMGPGDQMQGVNLRLARVHTVRVSGHVSDNTTPPLPPPADGGRGMVTNIVNGQVMTTMNTMGNGRIQLRLQPRNSLNPNGMNTNTTVRADGNFEFPSVAPGAYYLVATNNLGSRPSPHVTRLPIDVGSSNLEGLNISINPGVDIKGHVRYDGDPPNPVPSLTIRLTPREPFGIPGPQPSKVEDDGSFHFDDVNLETYNVNLNAPQGLYLKSVRSGNTDVLVSGLDLAGGAGALDIVLGVNPPVVGGTVANAETSQPAAAVTVVLIPREKERKDQSYFYSSNTTDQYGNFTFNRVSPGDYQVFAWEDVQFGQWFDPEWMKNYEGKGETITAKENSPVNVKLTMIPAK